MSLFGNSVLAGSAGQGGADLGAPIDQSLRFTKDQYLSRTPSSEGNRRKFTYSGWAKIADPSDSSMLFSAWGGSSFNTFELYFLNTANGNGLQVYQWNGSSYDATHVTSNKFRDVAAWYHIVMAVDTEQSDQANRMRLWVNNQEVSFSTNTQFSQNTDTYVNTTQVHRIGNSSYDTTTNRFDGYMAEVYFLDGQYLAPTDFGRYNEDGVWVPKNYTGTYGTNGFHLTFDSSQTNGIGHDSSGNGNNWTATGFDEGDVVLYSANLVSSSGAWVGSNTPDKLFDSSTSTFAQVSGAGETMTFTPTNPISYQSLHYNNFGATWELNDTTTGGSASASGWQTIDSNSGTLTTLKFLNTGGGQAAVSAIAINGTATANILVDNTDNDVDFLDTPTSNYATFNAVLHPNNQTLSNANLTGGTSSTLTSLTTQLPNYKYYWEATGSNYYYGISEIDAVRDSYLGSKANQVGWFNNGSFWVGTSNVGTFGPSFSTTDIAMQAYDPATGKYWVGINGTWHGSGDPENGTNPAYTVSASIRENMVPANNVASGTASYNFGQMNFLYTKPTGFEAIQTNILPEPTIKNGKEHFGVLTYAAPASPSFPITIDGSGGNNGTGELDFDQSPDLVWIKMRNGTQNHILFDTVRGASVSLRSDGNISEVTTRTNFAFATNGFTFSAQDAETYQQNDSYVAWCWKAGGTAVSNTDGTITSSVSANTDAGFSIVSYTGNLTAGATVGHGLSSPPECIFVKSRDSAANWEVKHVGLSSNDHMLKLNATDAEEDLNSWNNTAPTSTVFSLGAANGTNKSGDDFIAYCWHSVPGYSAFGSYTGNGSADGPFVYTGFRPAWVMIKCSTAGTSGVHNWWINDTTRAPSNPATNPLAANTNDSEADFSSAIYDINSNGFKLRGGSDQMNGNQTYIYCAFAENPFGGENAPPATAR